MDPVALIKFEPKDHKADGKVKNWVWKIECGCGYVEEVTTLDLACELRQKHAWTHRQVGRIHPETVMWVLMALLVMTIAAFWVADAMLTKARF